jgi:hypothetical protein
MLNHDSLPRDSLLVAAFGVRAGATSVRAILLESAKHVNIGWGEYFALCISGDDVRAWNGIRRSQDLITTSKDVSAAIGRKSR